MNKPQERQWINYIDVNGITWDALITRVWSDVSVHVIALKDDLAEDETCEFAVRYDADKLPGTWHFKESEKEFTQNETSL